MRNHASKRSVLNAVVWTAFVLGAAACATSPTPDDFAELEQPLLGDCTVISLDLEVNGQYEPGAISMTAAGSCGAFGAIEYEFWFRHPDGTWTTPCGGYSTTATCSISGLPAGAYRGQVWAKHAATGPTSFDAKKNSTPRDFTINIAPAWGACSDATVSIAPSSYAWVGDAVTISGSASCGGGTQARAYYRRAPEPFVDSNANMTWDPGESFTDRDGNSTYDGAGSWLLLSATWNANPYVWTSVSVPGGYVQFQTEVRGDPNLAAVFSGPTTEYQIRTGTPGVCTATSLVPTPNPAAVGFPITLAATSTCTNGSDADYSFYVLVAGVWTQVCDWQTSNTCNFVPGEEGTFNTRVWVRRHGSASNTAESSRAANAVVGPIGDCSLVNATRFPGSFAVVGDQVTSTASSTCADGVAASYRTSQRIGDGAWNTICDWKQSNTCVWNTTGLTPALYDVRTEVRGYQGGTIVESIATGYQLFAAAGTCSITVPPSATPDPGIISGLGVGVVPTITSTVTCDPSVLPEYSYWVRDPLNRWTNVCTWSTSSSCTGTWAPTIEGIHRLKVDVRRQGSADIIATATTSIYNVTCDPADPYCSMHAVKASNVGAGDVFGNSVAVDGDTLVVGARLEDSNASGINGTQNNDGAVNSGAVYVFVRSGHFWVQQAYIKASNTGAGDNFGHSVAISGNTLVVSAVAEASSATGIGGNQADDSAPNSGALYVFTRSGTTWSQQAYIKASNSSAGDLFGHRVAIDGDTIVAGAYSEASAATGVNGDQSNNAAPDAGAAYVFTRSGTTWSQQAYLKASNTEALDLFGFSVAISGDSIAVGAYGEGSNATGIDGNQTDNSMARAGAVYVFTRNGTTWSQEAYFKASNTALNDRFGYNVGISGDTLVVSAPLEDSSATGVGGIQTDNSLKDSGALYVFTRSDAEWSQQAYIKASNTGDLDRFGWALAIDGDTIIAGAYFEDSSVTGVNGDAMDQADNSSADSGAAYQFTRLGSTWTQTRYLKATNSAGSGDQFGQVVGVQGSVLVVGARFEDTTATDSGAVYVFD